MTSTHRQSYPCTRVRVQSRGLAARLCIAVLTLAPGLALAGPFELGGLPVVQNFRLQPGDNLLALQGGHVRRYFFRDTTSYALYTTEPMRSYAALSHASTPVRMVVTVLMKQFTAEQFHRSWREQFAQALSEQDRHTLAGEIESFLGAFETLNRGEQLSFDFIPGEGLRISLRSKVKRVIPGDTFAQALLSVWLGPKCVDPELRAALLDGR